MKRKRYNLLDGIRGLAILNMVAYHAIWDLVYLYGVKWDWYQSEGAYVWQQGICWTFILVSGFCYPQARVRFGVLTLIGSCMLLMVPLERYLKKAGAAAGLLMSAALFFLTRNVNRGFLGFEKWNFLKLPGEWYDNWIGTYLGFPERGFYSSDYFSLIPWFFLFLTGYFVNRLLYQKNLLLYLEAGKSKILEILGRYSLQIYVLHQPLLYGGFWLLNELA